MDELIEQDLKAASQALEDLAGRRVELRQACEASVVEWRWASEGSDLQRPEPLYHRRYGLPAPRVLQEAPATPEHEQHYGIDAAGDIVVAREFMGPGSFREELRVRHDETVIGYRWSEAGEPLEINVARFGTGKLRSYVTVWPDDRPDELHGFSIERYAYDGDLVSEIEEETHDAVGDAPVQRTLTRIRASYDAAGRLVDVREHGEDGEKVLYRARGTGPTVAMLQRRVEDRLVATLPELVRAHAGDEPLYCLALHYHLEWPLPPTIGLGLERDRQAWVDRIDDGETLRLTVWNPAEFSNYRGETVDWDLTAIDPELARAMRGIPDNADDAAQLAELTLNRAARRLQALDWRSIATVTDDFVVYAVDYELSHLKENFDHSVPGPLRDALSSRSLI